MEIAAGPINKMFGHRIDIHAMTIATPPEFVAKFCK
jgi:hypothetical protein